ncbi:MAG: glycosyltransferase family 4 protein [Desulfatiglandaceae bacterium]
MNKRVIVFTANRGYALASSRILLIQHFLSSEWNVVLATAEDEESRFLCRMGAHVEPVDFNRGGFAPWGDMQAYRSLRAICNKWRPSLIQHFHAKPVILGTLAARQVMGDRVRVVNAITGLGHAFITGRIANRLAGLGYRLSGSRAEMTIFQNRDDLDLFLEKGWVEKSRARLIPASGVDVERFLIPDRCDRDEQSPVVVMLGRLLRQKGIPEFVEVAGRIQASWPKAKFLLAGEEDLVHPDAVTVQWVEQQKSVHYLGRLTDVMPLLSRADLLLFPSYREGVPRVVLESAATGLPTVAFDVPGVREAVRDGETGFLVAYGDIEALTQRVKDLLKNAGLRLRMGQAARDMVEKEFDVRAVTARYLCLYQELGVDI